MLTILLIQISRIQRLNIWAILVIYIFKYFELQVQMAFWMKKLSKQKNKQSSKKLHNELEENKKLIYKIIWYYTTFWHLDLLLTISVKQKQNCNIFYFHLILFLKTTKI